MMKMEEKLAAYRRRRKREEFIMSVKNKITEYFVPREEPLQQLLSAEEEETPSDSEDLASVQSDESLEVPVSKKTILLRILYFLLWIVLYVLAVKIEFGAIYFIVTALIFIYCNTRTGPKKKNEVSAYSVFNKNCESIDGTVTAEQLQGQMVLGGLF